MSYDDVRTLIPDDLKAVDDTIRRQLHSDVVLINQISHHIVHSGGKRLRPVLVLLAARACDYRGSRHQTAAAIVEFIHTATLLHDDVVDHSALRRGQETANEVWGNQASVLVGDFLYSRAFQMMVEINNMRVMDVMADATNTIAEGEVLQLLNTHDPETGEDAYLRVVYRKTARLFEAGTQIAAILSGQPPGIERGLAAYGRHIGTAFQLVDDVLDYRSSAEALGKNIGDDLAEGKPTLPLIYAMRNGSPEQGRLIREAIETGGLDRLDDIAAAVESTGGIDYTARLAKQEADRALASLTDLPDSVYADALKSLAVFAVERTY